MGTRLEPIDSPNPQQLIDKANTLTKLTLKLAIQKQSISTIATVGNTLLISAVPLNVGAQAGSTTQETGGPKSNEGSPSFTGGNGSTGGAPPRGGAAAGLANSGDVTT